MSKFVVSKDVSVPLTVKSPATVKLSAICTSSGRVMVTSADSLPDPETVILLAVPAMLLI